MQNMCDSMSILCHNMQKNVSYHDQGSKRELNHGRCV